MNSKEKSFEKMCRQGVICVFCVCILCGCTKKEQLIREPLLLEKDQETAVILQSGAEEAGGAGDGVNGGSQSRQAEDAALTVSSGGMTGTAEAAKQEIYVHICGAVNAPGVFALPEGSRVFDAVEAAGGFTKDASPDHINQAQTITDGCKIRIPTVEEAQAIALAQDDSDAIEFLIQEDTGSTGGHAKAETDKKVNINEADAAGLCTINGIGEGRAAAIIKYREAHGRFGSIEEIMQVDGIKQGVFDKIKDQISVK